jgi:hypothetical protein
MISQDHSPGVESKKPRTTWWWRSKSCCELRCGARLTWTRVTRTRRSSEFTTHRDHPPHSNIPFAQDRVHLLSLSLWHPLYHLISSLRTRPQSASSCQATVSGQVISPLIQGHRMLRGAGPIPPSTVSESRAFQLNIQACSLSMGFSRRNRCLSSRSNRRIPIQAWNFRKC